MTNVTQLLRRPETADMLEYLAEIAEEYPHFNGVLDIDGVSAGIGKQLRDMARSARASNFSEHQYIA